MAFFLEIWNLGQKLFKAILILAQISQFVHWHYCGWFSPISWISFLLVLHLISCEKKFLAINHAMYKFFVYLSTRFFKKNCLYSFRSAVTELHAATCNQVHHVLVETSYQTSFFWWLYNTWQDIILKMSQKIYVLDIIEYRKHLNI